MAQILIEYVDVAICASLLLAVSVERHLTILNVCRVGCWLIFVVIKLLLGVGIELLQEGHVIQLFLEVAAVGGYRDLAREVLAVKRRMPRGNGVL